jgi:hypothetical protein
MDDVGDTFEVLNLDDLLSDNDIRIDLPPLLESDEDEVGEHVNRIQNENLDPSMFLHATYYSFKRELGNYLIDWRMNKIVPSADTISTLDPTFFRREGNSLEAWHKGILKKWEKYGRIFGIQKIANGEDRLFNKKHPHLTVPYIDE